MTASGVVLGPAAAFPGVGNPPSLLLLSTGASLVVSFIRVGLEVLVLVLVLVSSSRSLIGSLALVFHLGVGFSAGYLILP